MVYPVSDRSATVNRASMVHSYSTALFAFPAGWRHANSMRTFPIGMPLTVLTKGSSGSLMSEGAFSAGCFFAPSIRMSLGFLMGATGSVLGLAPGCSGALPLLQADSARAISARDGERDEGSCLGSFRISENGFVIARPRSVLSNALKQQAT